MASLEELETEWEKDSKIDLAQLAKEGCRTTELHSKWYKFYVREAAALKIQKLAFDRLKRIKYEYYQGSLSEEELRENKWAPFQLRILKGDLPMYLDADPDIIDMKKKILFQELKTDFVKSVVSFLGDRRVNQIAGIMNWEKWTRGAG